MERATKIHFWYAILAIFGIVLLRDFWLTQQQYETIPYSTFQTLLAEGQIAEIRVGEQQISGTFKTPQDGQKTHFVTARVEPGLAGELGRHDVRFYGAPDSGFLKTVLGWLLPTLGFVLLWLFLVRPMMERQAGGLMSIGKSRAKVYVEKDTKVTFADVAGVDEAKEELREIIGFLKAPKEHGRLGARIPRGILLVGPPGTGKTLLARAVAGEAEVPFFSISGSEFVEMFVGVGAARVRDLFDQARKHAPCIIFIDELDALGRARGTFVLGGHDEKEQTLNQLLAELDGFDPSSGIVLLAATNRPEILDPALLRAGRFDRQVLVDRPDKKGRVDILKVHLRKVRLDPGLDVEEIAALTPGFTGADLANLVNEAAVLGTRRGAEFVTIEDFTRAVERIVAGLEKRNRLLNPHEREVIAYHEMGHALVAMALPGTDRVHKISIIPRGIGALGYTIQRPTEDRFLMSSAELENKITVLLGGRAAESIVFPHVSTGAADDLSKATDIANSMVTRFGMTEELGQLAYEAEPPLFLGAPSVPNWQQRRYGEATATKIDLAVRGIVDRAYGRAVEILGRNRATLEAGAKDLLARETLGEADIRKLATTLESCGAHRLSPAASGTVRDPAPCNAPRL
jgi:cell division protease FtsH